MSFTQSTFAPVGAHSSDTPNLFSYKTLDSLSEVIEADYFEIKMFQLREGDFMLIQASDGSEFAEVDPTRTGVIPVSKPNLKTAFGELSVAENTPIVQESAQYGLTDAMLEINSDGGTTQALNSLFTASTGTGPIGLASINTSKQLAYKPGQGALARFTSIFTAGKLGSLQASGLINSEDSFAFGFLNEDFGILFGRNGEVEYQELTVTTPAAGAESTTITINGSDFTVPLTSGSVEQNAIEIASSLTSQLNNFLVTANESVISIMNLIPGPNTTYSFSSPGAAVATFQQITAGVDINISIIKQSDWNKNKASFLNPELGNVYFIDISYLGFGDIAFYVEDPDTGLPLLVHLIKYANSATTPSVGNPTFRIGWLARNLGNTSDIVVSGGSCAGFIEGKLVRDSFPRGRGASIASVGLVQTNILTLRNRFNFGGRINRAELLPLLLSLGTDSTKGAIFTLTANAVFGSDAVFKYQDKDSSIAEYMDSPVTFTGGRVLASFFVTNGGLVINSAEFKSVVLPDDQLTLSGAVVQTPNALVAGNAVWQEDL